MDSAKSVLHSIVLLVQQVQNAISRFSASRSVRQVRQHSLVRLELEFQTIIDASRAILQVFDNPLLRRHYMLDDRLMDWVSGTEPETCLDTLKEMEKLLKIDHEVKTFSGFTPSRIGYQEDDVNASILLFYAHKAHFHFLLTTDIWNCEKKVPRQTMPSKNEEKHVQDQGRIQSTPTNDGAIEHQRKEIVAQKLKKLLKILDALRCSRKHQETSSIRQSDTCMWLPATDAYRSWKEGKYTFLWLQGKAGAGKSVLVSSVIDDLDNTRVDGELLAYFYCDFRSGRSTNAVEVMRSLLSQLTEQLCAVLSAEPFLDEILKGAETSVDSFYNVKALAHYLSKVAQLCPLKPFLIVDALDECREVETLIDGLILCSGDVRLFVSSRPLQNIIKMLSHFPCISMDKMTNELSADIRLHVTRELDSRSRLRTFDEELKEDIRSQLCARADGMFRWVQCQIDTLDKCTSVSEIRRVLETLPEGLEETYRRILIAIYRRLEDSRLVRRALVWLVAALRPMRLGELLEALMIDPIRRVLDPGFMLIKGIDFLEVSRSLDIHHKETDVVALSHMSVKECLLGELVQDKLPRYHIVLEVAHEQLARLCMAYISFCLDQMKDCRDRPTSAARKRDLALTTSYASRPLLKYVLFNGFSHLTHLGSGNTNIFKDMEVLQSIICRHAWEWDRMCRLVLPIRSGVPWPGSEHDFMMYTLIAFASDVLFHTFLDRSDLTPRKGINPLVYAAQFGKTDHVKALITRGADVNRHGLVVDQLAAENSGSDTDYLNADISVVDYPDKRKTIPIQIAVDHWHAEMLDLLIAEGSAIPAPLLTRVLRIQPHQFPLPIIRRLLQTAEFFNWTSTHWGNQPLLEAVVKDGDDYEQINGGDDMVLATKALSNAGYTAPLLLIAVEKGCVPVIRTLLSMDTSLPPDLPATPHPHAVVNVLATNGDTPLHVAMRLSDENKCLTIVKLLIAASCSACELDAADRPPIYAAVTRGFISVVEYLLSYEVPLPSRILFAASQTNVVKRVEMIRLLISKKANVHILKPNGDTLMHVIIRSFDRSICLEIAGILIDAGCDPTAHNPRGETPLHIAAKQGYHEVINYLTLFSSSSDISSLLHQDRAVQLQTLRSLIGNLDGLRFSPEEEAEIMQTALQFLDNEDKCVELAQIFIDAAHGLFAHSSGCAMLFDIAVRRGFNAVVERLTSQAVPLPSTILFVALQYRVPMISPLVQRGADVHIQDEDGNTLLHLTMSILGESQCLSTTKILVEAGLDPFTLNITNKQPIHVAVSRIFLSVANYLLSLAFNTGTRLPHDLLFAALQCRKCQSMVRLLVENGADVSHLAPDGGHLLQTLLRSTDNKHDCLQTIKMLCEAGSNTFAPDVDGKTPLHLAIAREFTPAVDYLLSRGVPLPSDILSFTMDPRSSTTFHPFERVSIASSLVREEAARRFSQLLGSQRLWG